MTDSADRLPLQLLQPLDLSPQRCDPPPASGESSLAADEPPVLSPDLAVTPVAGGSAAGGGERGWCSSRLSIERNGQIRSIWAVHLPGWQQLGWQPLSSPAAEAAAAAEAAVDLDVAIPAPEGVWADDPAAAAGSPPEPRTADALDGSAAVGLQTTMKPAAEPVDQRGAEPSDPHPTPSASDPNTPATATAEEPLDFRAMTKAQIISHCLSRYGVSLDGDRSKADLVAAAGDLVAAARRTPAVTPVAIQAPAGPDDLQLPDDLL